MMPSRTIFVAHAFTRSELDGLRGAIDSALLGSGFMAVYGDSDLVDGQILEKKIQPQIVRSDVCLCEISDRSRASVFIEYGIARGAGKPCVLLLRSGRLPPADLEGFDRIEYASHADLTRQLRSRISSIHDVAARAGLP
jgi:hypothetical protein